MPIQARADIIVFSTVVLWQLKLLANRTLDKSQKKGKLDYQGLMLDSFKELNRVLKPGKYMTVQFSNTSAAVWNTIQNSINQAGFYILNVF